MSSSFWKPKEKPREETKRTINRAQRRLDNYKPAPEKNLPPWILSLREVENDVDKNIKALQSRIKDVKEVSLKLEELTKMLKSGEISESIYKILLDELSGSLSSTVEEIFKIREDLELLKARAKIEWAKEKIGMEDIFKGQETRYLLESDLFFKDLYSKMPINKWQEIIDKVDGALSSLTFEEELSIIESYLSIVKGRDRSEESKETEAAKQVCQQRLNVLSEKWFSTRRDKIKRIMDLEAKASQLRDDIKEVEVRFAVGEFDRTFYELRMSELQGSLKNVEKEISELRNYISEIDLKIFKITELLKER